VIEGFLVIHNNGAEFKRVLNVYVPAQ